MSKLRDDYIRFYEAALVHTRSNLNSDQEARALYAYFRACGLASTKANERLREIYPSAPEFRTEAPVPSPFPCSARYHHSEGEPCVIDTALNFVVRRLGTDFYTNPCIIHPGGFVLASDATTPAPTPKDRM